MSNIEKIVADFGTCRDASIVGLQIDSYFSWWRYRCTGEAVFVCESSHWGSEAAIFYDKVLFAPTAEEVPLPFSVSFKHKEHSYMLRQTNLYLALENTSAPVSYYDEYACNFSVVRPNEASARLRMAIRIIEKIPEAKQWYIDNGYLKDGE